MPTFPFVEPEQQDPRPQDPPRPRIRDEMRSLMRKRSETIQQQAEEQLLGTFQNAIRSNPNDAAEAQRVAADLGVQPEFVHESRDVALEMFRRREFARRDLLRTSPVLAEQLKDLQFAQIAHDDLDNLSTTESLFGRLGQAFDVGDLQTQIGLLGAKVGAGLASGPDRAALKRLQDRLRAMPQSEGVLQNAAEVIGQMSGTLPLALGVGGTAAGLASVGGPVTAGSAFAWGTGSAVFTQSAAIEGGHAFLDMIEQGYDPSTARVAALGVGVVNGALEVAGMRVVAQPFLRAFSKRAAEQIAAGLARPTIGAARATLAKEYLAGVGAEVGTEVLQEAVQIAGDELARAFGSDLESRFATAAGRDEVLDRVLGVAAKTAQAMAVLGTVGPSAHYIADKGRAAGADQSRDFMQALREGAAGSKVRERSATAYEHAIAAMAKGSPVEELFVDGGRFAEVLAQAGVTRDQFARESPDLAKQVEQAAEHGGDVVVPVGEFASKLAGTKVGDLLMQHVRTSEEMLSVADAELFFQPGRDEEAAKAVEARMRTDETFAASARVVEHAMRQQLVETGRLTEFEAASTAKLYREFVAVQAERFGELPEQFHARFPLQVRAADFAQAEQRTSGETIPLEPAAPGPLTAPPGGPQPPAGASLGAKWVHPDGGTFEVQDTPNGPQWVRLDGPSLRSGNRGAFDPKRLLVLLNTKAGQEADASTVLHEFAHAFLTIYEQLAGQPNAPDVLRADFDAFLAWRGIPGIGPWRALSFEERRVHHEAFAYSFERYLFRGEAPSPQLEGLFARFRQWIGRVYRWLVDKRLRETFRREFGQDLPALSDEVRAVFDRMLASEQQVERAGTVRGLAPAFQTQAEAGMNDEQWAAYLELGQEAREAAAATLTTESLQQMRWLTGARSRVLRELQAEVKAERARIRAEVEQEVAERPVERARAWLKDHKLNTAAVHEILPPNAPERRSAAARRMHAKDGVPPDVAAPLLGFETGEQLVREVLSAPSFDEAVEARTTERLQQERGELLDDASRSRAVERALHVEARTRFAAVELRHLSRATEPVRVMQQAARTAALRILQQTPVRRVRPRLHSLAETKAAREALSAIRKGDSSAATEAKRRQLVQGYLAREAASARQEIDQAVRDFRRIFRGSDEAVAKDRDVDIVHVARAILAFHNLGTTTKTPVEITAALRRYDPEKYAELAPLLEDAQAGAKDWRDLTLDEFRALRDTVEHLWSRARRGREITVEGRKVERAKVVAELREQMRRRGIPQDQPGSTQDVTKGEEATFLLLGVRASLRRFEHWVRAMDGGEEGPFTRYLWNEVRGRVDAYRQDRNVYVQRMRDLVAKLDLPEQQIEAPELGYRFSGLAEVLGAMLHAGNLSNLRKLVVGRRWGEAFPDGEFDRAKWDGFVRRMVREGRLTPEHFTFLQAVWDLNEELKPRAQQVLHETSGFYFDEVTSQAFTIAFPGGATVTYRGGYVPARVDSRIVPEARQRDGLEGLEDLESGFVQMMPTPGRGFTKSRDELYARPLLLDVRLQVRHLDEVLRFVNLAPAIKDVVSIVRDREFADVLNRVDPTAIDGMIVPWLDRTAKQQMARPSGIRALDGFFTFLRRTAGVGIMFANVVNSAQQITGISNSAVYVRPRFLKAAAWRHLTTRGMAAEITRLSRFMDERLNHQVGQLLDEIDLALDPSTWGAVQRWTARHAYFMQRAVQNVVDVVTWSAAFEQATENGLEQDAAVREADSVVRRAQGSSTPEDVAAYEAGSPFVRLFTQFSGYFNTILNQLASAQPGDRAKTLLLAFSIPALTGAAIQQAFWGGWDDEEGDGYDDEVAAWALGSQLRAAASLAPGFGPAITSLLSSDRPGDRLSLSPAISAVQAAKRGVETLVGLTAGEQAELRGGDVRDLLTALSLLTGLPIAAAGKPLGYAQDVQRGAVVPSGAVDTVRGLLSGRASPGTR